MSNNRNLGNIATAITNATSGQVLTSQGSGVATFADAGGTGVTVYATINAMTSVASPSAGDLAYVTANTSLYQNNGNGWYKIATINTSPAISSVSETTSGSTTALSNNGTFTLTEGANTVVTITASDADEGTDLTYSHQVTSGTESNVATITQGAGASENVFTFAPASATGGTLVVRFDVTDNTNTAQFTHSFSLQFTSYFTTYPSTAINQTQSITSTRNYNNAGCFEKSSSDVSTWGNGLWLMSDNDTIKLWNYSSGSWVASSTTIDIPSSLSSGAPNWVTGIADNGSHLAACTGDANNGRLAVYNKSSQSWSTAVTGSVAFRGLTWDGSNFWMASYDNNTTLYKVASDFSSVTSYAATGKESSDARGIAFDAATSRYYVVSDNHKTWIGTFNGTAFTEISENTLSSGYNYADVDIVRKSSTNGYLVEIVYDSSTTTTTNLITKISL